jgi:16S rRNA (guanine(966)-N(2))-methyltransferase RsmD
MGFEAASRGAESVVMVESSGAVLQALKFNLSKLRAERIELVAMDGLKFVDSDQRRFDVIFLDPPYRLGLLPKLLSTLDSHLAKEGLVYLESDSFREPDKDWLVWRKGLAGKVHYGLLKSKKNG